ncbi:ABC transporter permease [Pseudaminobacter arsenicus]|uniref:ABC transporter permease n=1 Tax=Borborobacter arsenicus TaxID=1851146 RepID=A0A432V7Z6_9HYPH|nr:ABC transporter permease [Pseudaminobacter arsenicus]
MSASATSERFASARGQGPSGRDAGSGFRRWRGWQRVALLAPVGLFLLAFFAYPMAKILALSFSSEASGLSLENYVWFFETSVNIKVLLRTFTTAMIVTLVCVLVGYPYAYLMTVVGTRWRALLLILALIPFWTSLMTRNLAWLALLQPSSTIATITRKLGFGELQLLGTVAGVVVAMSQILLPFMVLPMYATLRNIDRRLLAAAEGLGARPSVAFVRVYLPLSAPGVVAGSLLVFVLSLGFYLTPAIIGSPQNSLLSQLIVTQVSRVLNWGHAGAMAMVLLLVTVVLIWLASLATRRNAALTSSGERS